MSAKFRVSPAAQKDYRVLGGERPSGASAAARAALEKAHSARPAAAIHVTPRSDGWAVKKAGGQRASTVQRTKAKAMKVGRAQAGTQGVRLVEHGKSGKITANTRPSPARK